MRRRNEAAVHHQDIDAAYMMGDDGDLDADLSALLEVPDLNSTDLASLGPSMTPAALASSFSPGFPPPCQTLSISLTAAAQHWVPALLGCTFCTCKGCPIAMQAPLLHGMTQPK